MFKLQNAILFILIVPTLALGKTSNILKLKQISKGINNTVDSIKHGSQEVCEDVFTPKLYPLKYKYAVEYMSRDDVSKSVKEHLYDEKNTIEDDDSINYKMVYKLTAKSFSNFAKRGTEYPLTATQIAILQHAKSKYPNNPKKQMEMVNDQNNAIEFLARNYDDYKDILTGKETDPKKKDEAIAECVNELASKKITAVSDKTSPLNKTLQAEADRKTLENKKEVEGYAPMPSAEFIKCNPVFMGEMSAAEVKNCNTIISAIAGNSGSNNNIEAWSKTMSLFVSTGKEEYNGYFGINPKDKSYCENCMGKNFKAATDLGADNFDPDSALGEMIKDAQDEKDSEELAGQPKETWPRIQYNIEKELGEQLITKKLQKELIKSSDILQQYQNMKALLPKDNNIQTSADNAFTCYNEDLIEEKLKEKCKGRVSIADAKDRFVKSFGALMGEHAVKINYGLFSRGNFTKAFDTLKDATNNKSKFNKTQCSLERDDYVKMKTIKQDSCGITDASDAFIDMAMRDNGHHDDELERKYKMGELKPYEYIAEKVLANTLYGKKKNGDKDNAFYNFLQGHPERNSIEKQIEINRNFSYLVSSGDFSIPLPDKYYKTGKDSKELNAKGRAYLVTLVTHTLKEKASVDPNMYAIMFDTDRRYNNKGKLLQGNEFDRTIEDYKRNRKTNQSRFSKFVKLGPGKMKKISPKDRQIREAQAMLTRFRLSQTKKCNQFIENITKYSCMDMTPKTGTTNPNDNLKEFSKRDIDNTLKEIAEINNQETPQEYEKLLVDIAVGSISCRHKADKYDYNSKDQLQSIDKEIPLIAQSDLTARNRYKTHKDMKDLRDMGLVHQNENGSIDNITAFTKKKLNCESEDLLLREFDCKYHLNKASCGKLGKENKKIIESPHLAKDLQDQQKPLTESAAHQPDPNLKKSDRTVASQTPVYNKKTSDDELLEKVVENGGGSENQVKRMPKALPIYGATQGIQIMNTISAPMDISSLTVPIERNDLDDPELDLGDLDESDWEEELESYFDEMDESYYDELDETTDKDIKADDIKVTEKDIINDDTDPTSKAKDNLSDNIKDGNPHQDKKDVVTELGGFGELSEAVDQEGNLLSPSTNFASTLNSSENQSLLTPISDYSNSYTANTFVGSESITTPDGTQEKIKSIKEFTRTNSVINENNRKLDQDYNIVSSTLSDDPAKKKELDQLKEKYKKLELELEIEKKKSELEKLKYETSLKKEQYKKTIAKEDTPTSSLAPTNRIKNPGKQVKNNISHIKNETNISKSNYTNSTGNNGSDNLVNGKIKSISHKKRGFKQSKQVRKNNNRNIAAVNVSTKQMTNYMQTGKKGKIAKEIDGYIQLLNSDKGSAIDKNKMLDIQDFEIIKEGKPVMVPHVLIIGDGGANDIIKVPLDEEYIDAKTINQIKVLHNDLEARAVNELQQNDDEILVRSVELNKLQTILLNAQKGYSQKLHELNKEAP